LALTEHSTGICSNVFKQTVDYYVNRGSHVFACFVDFKKAFDYVNYWKLFIKLLQDNIDASTVGMLSYWYHHHHHHDAKTAEVRCDDSP